MPNITANHAITYKNPVTCGMVSPADVMSFSQKVYIAAVEPHFQPRLQTFLMFGLAMNLVDQTALSVNVPYKENLIPVLQLIPYYRKLVLLFKTG